MNRSIAMGVLAASLTAQASALTFRFQYESPMTNVSGLSTVNATGTDIVNLTTVGGQAATGLTYAFNPSPGTFTGGTGTVRSSTGALNFTFMGDSSSTGMNGTIVSFTGGTGAYVGYTGSGVVSHTVNTVDPNYVDGQFFANVQPVPEPASMLALGVASAALIRRSRRAAR